MPHGPLVRQYSRNAHRDILRVLSSPATFRQTWFRTGRAWRTSSPLCLATTKCGHTWPAALRNLLQHWFGGVFFENEVSNPGRLSRGMEEESKLRCLADMAYTCPWIILLFCHVCIPHSSAPPYLWQRDALMHTEFRRTRPEAGRTQPQIGRAQPQFARTQPRLWRS